MEMDERWLESLPAGHAQYVPWLHGGAV
jgi:hypothetical protein